MKFRNVVRRISKLQSCEKLGRGALTSSNFANVSRCFPDEFVNLVNLCGLFLKKRRPTKSMRAIFWTHN